MVPLQNLTQANSNNNSPLIRYHHRPRRPSVQIQPLPPSDHENTVSPVRQENRIRQPPLSTENLIDHGQSKEKPPTQVFNLLLIL